VPEGEKKRYPNIETMERVYRWVFFLAKWIRNFKKKIKKLFVHERCSSTSPTPPPEFLKKLLELHFI